MKKVFIAIILILIAQTAVSEDFFFTMPDKHTIWIEGNRYKIQWRSTLSGKICLSILMGGKDRGFINNCNTPIKKGSFNVRIPEGFVSGFGIPSSNLCRIAACPVSKPAECFYSDYFTISAFKPVKFSNCAEAIRGFFRFINNKQFKKAYSMLSFSDYVLTDCYGEKIYFPKANSFENFKKRFSEAIKIKNIENITDPDTVCSATSTIGIRVFKVKLAHSNIQQTFYIFVAKDINNACRIVKISSNLK